MDINNMTDTLEPEEGVLEYAAGPGERSSRLQARVNPSSISSRSSDHRRSRDDSPEYDRREGRDVSMRYSDDRDYRDCSEPSPCHGRDNRDYDIKRSRYETSTRTPGIAQV
ncbi:hypothetical protein Tco_0813448 [Tanacetum coccineum]